MPSYIVNLKDDVTPEQLAAAKKQAVDQGGKITQEYTLIKGFAVEYPEGHVHALDSIPDVQSIDEDSTVTTQ